METNFKQSKAHLKVKIPEIEKTLSMVQFLKEKQAGADSVKTHFSLADAVYGTADVAPSGTVCLWLGANVMLEYPYDEAEELLSTNLAGAKEKLVRPDASSSAAHLHSAPLPGPHTSARPAGDPVLRSHVPPGPDHHDGSQHCALLQL